MSNTAKGASKGLLAKLAFGLAMLMLGSQAFAAQTAANAVLENQVTVSYDNLANVSMTPVQASVSVSINLVYTAPTVSVTPSSFNPVEEGGTVTSSYRITSASNGPDTYSWNILETANSNLDAATSFSAPSSVNLAATTIGSISNQNFTPSNCIVDTGNTTSTGTCTVEVPNDGADDGTVNGFSGGEVALIDNGSNQVYCTVDSVVDKTGSTRTYTPGAGDSTITFKDCFADAAQTTLYTANSQTFVASTANGIFETTSGTIDFTVGNVSSGSTGTSTVSGYVVDGNPSATVSDQTNVSVSFTVEVATLTVTKYVRNVTTSANNPGISACGSTVACLEDATSGTPIVWYASGVTAAPNEVLEYAILVQNAGNLEVKNVVINDPYAVFTSYEAGSIAKIPVDSVTCAGSPEVCTLDTATYAGRSTATNDTLGTSSDFGGDNGPNVLIYAGTGGDEATTTGGNVDVLNNTTHTGASVGFYQVRVNN